MSGGESKKVFGLIEGKYSRNPCVLAGVAKKKLVWLKKQRDWRTGGLYRESGQVLMEKFVENKC